MRPTRGLRRRAGVPVARDASSYLALLRVELASFHPAAGCPAAGLVSVALVLASRRAGVTRYPAPESPDVPHAAGCPATRDRPIASLTPDLTAPAPAGRAPGSSPSTAAAIARPRTRCAAASRWTPSDGIGRDERARIEERRARSARRPPGRRAPGGATSRGRPRSPTARRIVRGPSGTGATSRTAGGHAAGTGAALAGQVDEESRPRRRSPGARGGRGLEIVRAEHDHEDGHRGMRARHGRR